MIRSGLRDRDRLNKKREVLIENVAKVYGRFLVTFGGNGRYDDLLESRNGRNQVKTVHSSLVRTTTPGQGFPPYYPSVGLNVISYRCKGVTFYPSDVIYYHFYYC